MFKANTLSWETKEKFCEIFGETFSSLEKYKQG